jgi:hypothetical protein
MGVLTLIPSPRENKKTQSTGVELSFYYMTKLYESLPNRNPNQFNSIIMKDWEYFNNFAFKFKFLIILALYYFDTLSRVLTYVGALLRY